MDKLRWLTAFMLLATPVLADVSARLEIEDACRSEKPALLCEEAVEALLDDDEADDADRADAFRERAGRYFDEDKEKALADYTAAIDADPIANDYFNRALILRLGGNEDAALTDLHKAVELRPTYGKAWLDISLILGNRGRHAEAIEAAGNAIQRDVKLPGEYKSMAWNNVGNSARQIGLVLMADVALAEAVASDPQNAAPRRHQVRLYWMMKDKARAQAALDAAKRVDPDSSYNSGLESLVEKLE